MLKILVIGAHPDDCDALAGGTAALWIKRGDQVRFVSLTSGNAGHHTMKPKELAERRRAEAKRAGAIIGVEYDVLDLDDGRLEPSVERREEVIRLIRRHAPDLVLTHRPNDYHPDHRYTAVLVQDSSYMVTVPLICPDTPHLRVNPVIAYFADDFTRPNAFTADVAVDVDSVMDLKWAMLHSHVSQFYEWLPYNDRREAEVPAGDAERLAWLKQRWSLRLQDIAEKHRDTLARTYGADHAADVEYAEAFEVSEYGDRPRMDVLRKLFPVR